MDSPLLTSVTAWQSRTGGKVSSAEIPPFVDCLRRLAKERVFRSLGHALNEPDDGLDIYATRLWKTINLQMQKKDVIPVCVADLQEVVADLESGQLFYGRVDDNVLHDVAVAQGLELHDNDAAQVFERFYMPLVRAHANQFGGKCGIDAVDNLAADFVLPRKNRPPKIATYLGLTPLKSWLRTVVINRCISSHRGRQDVSMPETFEVVSYDRVAADAVDDECETRLAPAFAQAVAELGVADRMLLKMSILDGVPQNQLAKSYGIDPGNLSRRKQRAAGTLLSKIRHIGVAAESPAAVRECLELLLAGESRTLQMRLANLLAAEIGQGSEPNSRELL